MALYKEYTAPNGVVTRYHRIVGVSKKGNCLSVTVGSYASEDYRKIEGDELTIDTEKFKALRSRITELSIKEDKTEEEIAEYEAKRQEFYDLGLTAYRSENPKNMAVQTILFIVPLEGDDISYQMIYNELKQTEEFYGATDC